MRINSSFIEERYDSFIDSLGTLRDKVKESVYNLLFIAKCSCFFLSAAIYHSSQFAKSKWQAIASWFKSKNINIISDGSEQAAAPVVSRVVFRSLGFLPRIVGEPRRFELAESLRDQIQELNPIDPVAIQHIREAREMNNAALQSGYELGLRLMYALGAHDSYVKAVEIERRRLLSGEGQNNIRFLFEEMAIRLNRLLRYDYEFQNFNARFRFNELQERFYYTHAGDSSTDLESLRLMVDLERNLNQIVRDEYETRWGRCAFPRDRDDPPRLPGW